MTGQREGLPCGHAHQAGSGKAVEHHPPTRGDELPVGQGLGRLAGRRDQDLDQAVVVIEVHPQVELGLGKRDGLPCGRSDQLHGHVMAPPSGSDHLRDRSLVAGVRRRKAGVDAQQLRRREAGSHGHRHATGAHRHSRW